MLSSFRQAAIAAISALTLSIGILPAQAIQMPVAPQVDRPADVQNVQYCAYGRCGPPRGYYGRPGYYPGYRPGYRPYRPAYRPGWYGGYRGYSYYRPGYRHYNGYWYPLAAFGAGAIIGGAIAAPRYVEPAPRYVVPAGSAHVSWCQQRYRSYRAYDNTFQPYNGPRQQCISPY